MKLRQALKITNNTKITDLKYANDSQIPLKFPLVAIGVKDGYRYSWRQFKEAYRVVTRYFSRRNRYDMERHQGNRHGC